MVCVRTSINILVEFALPLKFTNLTTTFHYCILSHGTGSGLALALGKDGWSNCSSTNEPLTMPEK